MKCIIFKQEGKKQDELNVLLLFVPFYVNIILSQP